MQIPSGPLAPPENEEPQPVRTIARADYWAAMGLAQRHSELMKELHILERMVAVHVGEPMDPDSPDYFGHVSDGLWEGSGIDDMLRRLNVKVEPIEEEK
ncbi:MAG: hypothetical protein KAR39_12685 [Thermoplasmata archaeon]|nr:hypothetical protein [Thermoplasmata archaeon]